MKKVLSALILIGLTSLVFAQAPNWKWAETNTGGSSYMQGMGIGVSQTTGNVYFNYRSGASISFGGGTSSNSGGGSWVGSAKVNNAGVGSWSVAHSSSFDYCYGFGLDKNDNSYTTGIYSSGYSGYFVDKTDPNGNILWTNSVTVNGPGGYGNIAVDSRGYVYVSGTFSGNINFGSGHTVNAGAGGSIFLAKYAPSDGHCVWVKNYGSNGGSDGARGVYIDPTSKYLYMVGYYSGSATFGSITTPAAAGLTSLFVSKLDTAGSAVWVSTATNAGYCTGAYYWSYNGITVDSCSNVYVTGHFQNTSNFVNASGTAFSSITSAGSDDIYVGKCLSNGNWEWVNRAGGTGSDLGIGIAVDKHSDVYLTGYFAGTANFSGQTVSTSASNEIFVAKYNNSSGALQWVLTPTGTGASNGSWVTVNDSGYVYVTGNTGSATYGPSTVSGSILIAKIDSTAPRYIVPAVNTNYCTNVPTALPYSIVGTFNAGNKFIAELSDANGSFADPLRLDSVTSTASGTINITIPTGTTPGSTYLIRVISTSPATSSWANGTGNYYAQNSYPNDFYVTIGGSLPVTVTPANPAVCNGSSVTVKVVGGSSAYTYAWTGSATTADSLIVSPTTTTSIPCTVSVTGACSGSTTFTVTVNTTPTVTISGNTTVCSGISSLLTANAGAGTTYVWSDASTNNTLSVAPTVNGTKYYVVGTNAGCSDTGKATITVNPLPTMVVTPSNPEICPGGSIPLLASGAGVTGSYTWAPSTGISTPSAASANGNPTNTTTYTITGMDLNGCQNTTTVTLTVNPVPVPVVSATQTICSGSSANLMASGGTSYTWTPDTAINSNTIAAPLVNPMGTMVYTVTVPNGSCSATALDSVVVNTIPTGNATGTATILVGANTPLGVSNAQAGNTYNWTPAASLSCNTCINPVATPSVSTWYYVTVSNSSGCSEQDSVLITVNQSCGPIYMANAFSPNGDGSNDVLKVQGNCIKGINLEIYDRWGNMVYQSTNPDGVWDGTSKGKNLNTGTYIYTLVITDADNNTINKKGNITLLR